MEGVSCIIPCYNEVSRIRNVLEAVKSNSKINEIIVVDDASEDGSSEVIRQFDGVVYVRLEKNRGKSASVYEGFKISKYDVILLLDADIKN
ncbi:MAG: glycosyltransferase family 2 protein, partial [archaeon]|nr:glycosyltransferase family 2 protein [archaeon]